LGCGDQATITEPGRSGDYIYVAGTDLEHVALRTLGLPGNYGLGTH
jgi:hypothetical protein